MTKHNVSIFRPYPFHVGQKIRIEGTKREGDWEVANIGENKVTLRCPITKKEFSWEPFCYHVEEKHDHPWPIP
ncbi:MAG: hypothetical protein D8M57_13605 [Candidatus Scalindua sp. AMX11]|nr:MAG: hypothetical protein DWQ00_06115 [Candidatus Scalindua sp.]NOG83439.1 hypothetical protein [Planctomycetota bacterium]RZV75051.1 MAG: hypothetical protein EX341_12640 [Candidatus Scalindua sp. SCAELEC01]TDE64312.1 MAG: hypothetical protein D8M57_13605 [Candidatus Scalindua sp. AMX11]GJQ60629.1 MAG: hypothetical protein SCALA701_34300 [Candidatus Scalindua sp.]